MPADDVACAQAGPSPRVRTSSARAEALQHHGRKTIQVHTLQAGDDVLLGEGVRVTVLAVEGDTVLLQITGPETTGAFVGALAARASCQDALTALPSEN